MTSPSHRCVEQLLRFFIWKCGRKLLQSACFGEGFATAEQCEQVSEPSELLDLDGKKRPCFFALCRVEK